MSSTLTYPDWFNAFDQGHASGIVPDSFRLLRNIISRIEDPVTGTIVDDFQVEIPQNHVEVCGPSFFFFLFSRRFVGSSL